MSKTKATLSLEEQLWLEFRAECLKRKLIPSNLIDTFMAERLKEWKQTDTKPEPQPAAN